MEFKIGEKFPINAIMDIGSNTRMLLYGRLFVGAIDAVSSMLAVINEGTFCSPNYRDLYFE